MFMLKIVLGIFFTHFSWCNKVPAFYEENDFITVSKTKGFVDKTLLIKSIFETGHRILITAPRKFGKSTNLQMLKIFLSNKSNENKEISDTFQKLKLFKNDTHFYNEHFGKYPVLYIDFKIKNNICNYNEALYQYRYSIHQSYREHRYLIDSSNLMGEEREKCRNWCVKHEYMVADDITCGLEELAYYLKVHHKKPVVILIDEYDCVINDALFNTKRNRDINSIVGLTTKLLGSLLKSNKNVAIAVVTGISSISSSGLSDNNLRRFGFLDDHPFVSFYGFLKSEVDSLLNKECFHLNQKEISMVYRLYDGYSCRSGLFNIFNPYSFLHFLNERKTESYWESTHYTSNLFNLFRYPNIERNINILLRGKSIQIIVYKKISILDVLKLKDLYQNNLLNKELNKNLVFSHLLELGYLTYAKSRRRTDMPLSIIKSRNVRVKIPNKQMKDSLLCLYKQYYVEVCKLDEDIVNLSYAKFKNVLESKTHGKISLKCEKFITVIWRKLKDWWKLIKNISSLTTKKNITQKLIQVTNSI